MQKTRVRRVGALIVGLSLVAAACGDDEEADPVEDTAEEVTEEPVSIESSLIEAEKKLIEEEPKVDEKEEPRRPMQSRSAQEASFFDLLDDD